MTSVLYGRFIGHFAVRSLLAAATPEVLGLPRFTIVRNPWSRLASAYEFARAGSGSGGPITVSIARPRRYRGEAYADFEYFVRDHVLRRQATQLDGVFRLQSYFVCDGAGGIPFDHVGRFEAIAQTEDWLSGLLRREVQFPHFNAAPGSDYRALYSPALRNLVGDHYARDVASFGYDF